MRENIKRWKASLEGTLNMDKWGGQIIFHVGPVLRKIVQVCSFTCSKIFFITFGPPNHQRSFAPNHFTKVYRHCGSKNLDSFYYAIKISMRTTLQEKNPVTTGKIIAITTKLLRAVVINFEAIGLRNTKISLQ